MCTQDRTVLNNSLLLLRTNMAVLHVRRIHRSKHQSPEASFLYIQFSVAHVECCDYASIIPINSHLIERVGGGLNQLQTLYGFFILSDDETTPRHVHVVTFRLAWWRMRTATTRVKKPSLSSTSLSLGPAPRVTASMQQGWLTSQTT